VVRLEDWLAIQRLMVENETGGFVELLFPVNCCRAEFCRRLLCRLRTGAVLT
jgi:hypothetical protein